MKPIASALATLPLILAAALPAAATQSTAATHAKIILMHDQDGIAETFESDELSVGQSRQIVGSNGNIVTLTRAADALTLQADGKTIRIPASESAGALSKIELLRHGDDGESRRIVMLRGDNAFDIGDDLAALEDLDLGIVIEKALGDARGALDTVDQATLAESLARARAQIDAIDIEALIAGAEADGNKVIVIRKRHQETDTAD